MTRFIFGAMLWMCVSFALLWWVQSGVDRFHAHAAQAVGGAIDLDPPALDPPAGNDEAARVLAEALRDRRTSPRDLAQLEFDRRQVMHRLRVLWIILTLTPVLIGAWWAVRSIPPARPHDRS
jgi:hypothetical protein